MLQSLARAPHVPAGSAGTRSNLAQVAWIVGASWLVAAAAHVAVPAGFTPVPFTLQSLAVMLIGLLMGPWAAGATLTAYLLQGAAGLPMFAPTGPGGMSQLFGTTGGFLLSYPLAALIVSRLAGTTWVTRFFAACAGFSIILLFGAVWLSGLAHLSLVHTLSAAVLPFVPGELIKAAAAAGIATALVRVRQTQETR